MKCHYCESDRIMYIVEHRTGSGIKKYATCSKHGPEIKDKKQFVNFGWMHRYSVAWHLMRMAGL